MPRRPPKRPAAKAKLPEKPSGNSPGTLVKEWYLEVPEGEAAYTVEDTALAEMIKLGIKLPERPLGESRFLDEDGCPVMPENILELGDRDIGELYGIVQSFHSYVLGQLVLIKNRLAQAGKQVGFISARVRIGKDGTSKDKDDRMTTDRRYVMADSRTLELQCLYNLVSKVAESIDGDLRLISRNISLREQGLKVGARMATVDARKRIGVRRPARLEAHRQVIDVECEKVESPKPRKGKPRAIRPPRRRK